MELTSLQRIIQGYDELKSEMTKGEDKAATLEAEQQKVVENEQAKQTGKTFYELLAESNPFSSQIAHLKMVDGYNRRKQQNK
ncbi:hypothetical protein WAZ07_03405 [Bacillus sp. FJAT-51639]|uniref:Uncharacterized protein n=1 Tax=Bacillus bruguierae TaxID=3127667 RepID=A0ABU8FCI1_9BACI